MTRTFIGLATFAIAAMPAFAQVGPTDSVIWSNPKPGLVDGGWVVQFPTASSDYFDQTYDVVLGIGNSEGGTLASLPVTGVSVSVTDFGSGRTYATVGMFNSNLVVDASGETPDLASPLFSLTSPPLSPPALFQFVTYNPAGDVAFPVGTLFTNTVVQLPPGDSGLLGVGADANASVALSSGFTTDGYTTPSIGASFLDWGMSAGQDNTATTSCKQADRKPSGRMRASNLAQGIGEGDKLTATVKAGDTLDLAFFGSKSGDKWRIYFNVAPCTPAVAIGPVLPTIPDSDGDGTFLRVNATWPAGFGGQTFRFSAVWGNPACSNPGVGFTNCVTIITNPDPTFGVCDDGTIESGWVVQFPSGSSDYFNNNLGDGTSAGNLTSMTISVLDFVTATPAYPTSGVSNANLGVDPSGNTPDIGSPLATVSPFTFPSGSFETTSGLYTSKAIAVPGGSLGTNVSVWVQFPPGDSGLLGVGADTSSGTNGCSFFTLDGYSSPAVSFFANWGMRVN